MSLALHGVTEQNLDHMLDRGAAIITERQAILDSMVAGVADAAERDRLALRFQALAIEWNEIVAQYETLH